MIYDFDFYGYEDGAVYDTVNIVHEISKIELTKAIFDEIHILGTNNFICSTAKKIWQLETVLKATFQNNLEGGNINFDEQVISYIQLRKRKIEDFEYIVLDTFDFDIEIEQYKTQDKYIQSDQEYEYSMVPLLADYTMGEEVTARFTAKLNKTWLFDKENNYYLLYDLDYSNITQNSFNTIYTPMARKYPIVVYNADTFYKSGSISALLVADNSAMGVVSVKDERYLRNNIINFLGNKKPKIIKDIGGNYFIISIVGNPVLNPVNSLNQQLYEITFDWVEVGDAHDENTLIEYNLKEGV